MLFLPAFCFLEEGSPFDLWSSPCSGVCSLSPTVLVHMFPHPFISTKLIIGLRSSIRVPFVGKSVSQTTLSASNRCRPDLAGLCPTSFSFNISAPPAPQVMQFGRIDGNAYILDFQYPFSAVQAFAVALANVTQRLK